jgi:hypothetical protein
MAKFVNYSITSGTGANLKTFYFRAPDNVYDGIETETGVSRIADNDDENSMPKCKVEELLHSPVATRRKIRYGTGTGRKKYTSLVVAASKAIDFDTTIIGKAYKGGTITAVVESLDAIFS